jgi:hypothetical protein
MASTDVKETPKGGHKLRALCVFQDTQGGNTVQTVAKELEEYGPAVARIILLTDGKGYFLQVKAETGDGGGPLNESHPCPGSPGCP